MRICRFNEDRLGIILSDGLVHDVTAVQSEIRASAPYTMNGDPVIKALPAYRDRLLAEAAKGHGVPVGSVKLLAPVESHGGAVKL
jgi:hypothetical protein